MAVAAGFAFDWCPCCGRAVYGDNGAELCGECASRCCRHCHDVVPPGEFERYDGMHQGCVAAHEAQMAAEAVQQRRSERRWQRWVRRQQRQGRAAS